VRVLAVSGYARNVKRHAALVPLSHDHHDALVAARRLRHGADGAEPAVAAADFLGFFAAETVRHFREEEELLFPQVVDRDEARELVVVALLDHQRLHALAAELTALLAAGEVNAAVMRALAEGLEAHIRLEERRLFPMIERLLANETLNVLALVHDEEERSPGQGSGPIWGAASEDLNATLLLWNAGGGTPEHVNAERDVLIVVLAGSVTVRTDEGAHRLCVGETTIIDKGQRRQITAGREGARYLSVHRRRQPLQIKSAPRLGRV
jgi:hemerythrin-like domain-containing protein